MHYAILDELCRFKRDLGLRAMKNLDLPWGVIHLLQGVNFYRCWEFPLVLSHFDLSEGTRVLDVGAYTSFFPWVMASQGCELHVIDTDPKVGVQRKYARYLGLEDLLDGQVHITVQDSTATAFIDDFFDLILNISAVEHFPGDGDIEFMREANRILKPGGRLFLSFGIGEEYQEGDWEWMFCRTYDEEALHRRIIEPSGLAVESKMHFEDKNTRRFTAQWFRLPLLLRNGLLGWLQAPIFKRLHQRDKAREGEAHYLALVLRKD